MAINIFGLQEDQEDQEQILPTNFSDIFGSSSEEVLKPRGSATLGDYFTDIVFQAPAKGLGTAVKGLLQIPAFAIDFALDTDTLTKLDKFFSEGFFKIPETETGIGDITAALVQYGLPISRATKVAQYIPGLKGLNTFNKIKTDASITEKAGELAKRAGYFGAIGGLTDIVVSSPGINQTAGEQFGLYEGYQGEGLSGRDKATEVLKSKLKFGAEGATLGGAIPLLPVAGTLGFKYGLKPAGQAIGYVGNNAIRAINYTVRNPIAEILSGGKVAGVNVPGVIPSLVKKAQSGMDTVEKGIINILPAQDTALGRLINGANKKFKEWMYVNGEVDDAALFDVKNSLIGEMDTTTKNAINTIQEMNQILKDKIMGNSYKAFESGVSMPVIKYNESILQEYFATKGVVKAVPKLSNLETQLQIAKEEARRIYKETLKQADEMKIKTGSDKDFQKNKMDIKDFLKKKTEESINKVITLEEKIKLNRKQGKPIYEKDKLENIVYEYKYFEDETTKKILDSLDKRVVGSDAIEYAKQIKQKLAELGGEVGKLKIKESELKNGFMEFIGTASKQGLASFNNKKFIFDELKEGKVIKLFKDEVLLSRADLRDSVKKRQLYDLFKDDPIITAIKRGGGETTDILNITEKNLNNFNKKYGINLDINAINNYKTKLNTSVLDDTVFSKVKNKNEIINLNSNNIDAFNKKYKTKVTTEQINNFKNYLDKEAKQRTTNIKDATIRDSLDTNQIFKNISDQLGGDIGRVTIKKFVPESLQPPKPGALPLKPEEINVAIDSLPKLYEKINQLNKGKKTDLRTIVDFLSIPKGSTVKIDGKIIPLPESNYNYGVLDSILFLNKQRYQGKFFDALLDLSSSARQPDIRKKLILTEEEMQMFGRNKENLTNIQSGQIMPGTENIIKADLLNGTYYAKPEIINAIKNLDSVLGSNLMNNEFYKSFMKLKGYAQFGGTVLSPTAQARNATGNFFNLFGLNLLGSKISLGDSWKIAFQDLFKNGKLKDKEFRALMDDYATRGIIQNNAQIEEVRKIFIRANDGKLNLDNFLDNKFFKNFTQAYQLSDNAPKIFADRSFQSIFANAFRTEKPELLEKGTKAYNDFINEAKDFYRTVLKKDFVDMNYVTNELKTPKEILGDLSAEMVTNLLPTYSKVPKAVRLTRELPIGNFASYPSEVLRNSSKIVLFGARALTSSNPYIRQMGAHFLIGASAVFGGLGYIVTKTAESLTGVNEEKIDAFKRSFAASYQKNSTLVPVTKADENGNFKFYNFSYTNPYDTIVKPANAILGAFADGSLNKDSVDKMVINAFFGNNITGRKGAFGELFAPFISESIGTERAFDIFLRDGVKKEGGKVFYPNDDASVKITKGLEHIIGGIVPGGVKSAQRIWEGATGKFTDAGTIRDMSTEITAVTTGIRMEDAKPLASMPFIVTSYNKDKQNVDRKFAEIAYRPSATMEQRLDAYTKYLTESYDSQNKMYQVLKDGQLLGIDESDLKDIVQTRLNNKRETDSLFNGAFKVPTFNEKAFDSMITRLQKEDSRAAVKIESQIDVIKEIYKDLNSEFQGFDLGVSKEQFENTLNRVLTPGVREIRRQPQRINVLPSSSTPVTPGTSFAYNAPNPSKDIVAGQQQQTLGSQYNLLSSADKANLLFR
jgi:hypothetical protein